MYIEPLPLARQLEMVFRALREELASLASGTIFVQIRNNLIGKFGVKCDSLTGSNGAEKIDSRGLAEHHQAELRRMGLLTLERKRWTHGEIYLGFELSDDALHTNITMESNYNMNALLNRPDK